jgi:hypothetical protein
VASSASFWLIARDTGSGRIIPAFPTVGCARPPGFLCVSGDSNRMNWGSDELHHRSAERSGWAAELREADPADVDDSVTGAVAFADATAADPADGPDSEDSEGPTDDTEDAADGPTRTCGFCRGSVSVEEACDADGLPVGGCEWIGGASAGETEAYHRECVEGGEGAFLAWGANGVLGDETE